jgi:hypothetical protein
MLLSSNKPSMNYEHIKKVMSYCDNLEVYLYIGQWFWQNFANFQPEKSDFNLYKNASWKY